MSASQRAQASVPLAQRSVVPTIPGVAAGVAVAIAVGCSFVGFLIDASGGSDLTRVFSVLYFLGCVAAVLAVRHRGLFTAVVQPPLLLFIAVPLAYQHFTEGGGASVKDILLNVAIPLVNRFPLMLVTTAATVIIGIVRFVLERQGAHSPQQTRTRRTPVDPGRATRTPRRTPPAQSARSTPSTQSPRSTGSSRTTTPPPRGTQSPRTPQPTRTAQPTRAANPPRSTHRSPRTAQPTFARDYPPPEAPRRSTPESRARPEVPAHPLPNVRYRDEPPYRR